MNTATKFPQYDAKLMIKGLEELKGLIEAGNIPSSSTGICFNLQKVLRQNVGTESSWGSYACVAECSMSWPEYSGDVDYPVKENHKIRPWEGVNYNLRMNLIDHIIKVLEGKVLEGKVNANLDG